MRFTFALSTTAAVLAAAHPHAKRAAIDECLEAAGVPVDHPDSEDWELDVNPFNQRLPYLPAAIAVPSTLEHIQAAVLCAAQVGVKVNPKSGGHSYASFGLGGEDGHLVVQLDRMNNVTLDTETNIATVQPGARLGHVATLIYEQGKRAFSHGTCPGVGVGGHALHGGFGFSSHTHGLAVDWIVGATVVLANGTAVQASETENKDIFWALKGAGSSFGIVSSFQFNTFAAPKNLTTYQVRLPWGPGNATNIVKGWGYIQDWLSSGGMPEQMNMRVLGDKGGTNLQGMYYGSACDMKAVINPLAKKLNATLWDVKETDWMGAFENYAYSAEIDITRPYEQVETFYSKSLVTPALPKDVLQDVANYWTEVAPTNNRTWFIIIDMYGGPNSAITKVPTSAGSYAYRDPKKHLFLYELYDRINFGDYPDNGFSFLDGWVGNFTQGLGEKEWGMYVNYADPRMSRTEAQEVYYRQSLPRLRDIKKKIDPTDLFYYPQAVQPAE